MRVLDAHQMREADRRTIEECGVAGVTLMERAGRAVAAETLRVLAGAAGRAVAVLCGRGNNGGDGFVVARVLNAQGARATTYLVGAAVSAVRGDARVALDALTAAGGRVVEVADEGAWRPHAASVRAADAIVDALVGTGLHTALTGVMAGVVEDVNASGRPVVAVDLPSGLSADHSRRVGPAVRAAVTVTFAAPKLALVQPPGEDLSGRVVVADIGIPPAVIETLPGQQTTMLTREYVRRLLPERRPQSHKGTYGHVLVVAGSEGRTGAAALAGLAALRSGAGLVTVATPRGCQSVVAALAPEYMTMPLEEDHTGAIAEGAAEAILAFNADAIAVGPGLGRGAGTRAVVDALLTRARSCLVLDADALQVYRDDQARLRPGASGRVAISPHPGEMAALLGITAHDVQDARLPLARDFARANGIHVVLKGRGTVVAAPDGRAWINTTGNPGMATAGSGDVLTGMLAAWPAQLSEFADACTLAVYLHGLAGDLAWRRHGPGLMARDILDRLGIAARDLAAGNGEAA